MRLRFHPAAVNEMVEAASYYDLQRPGVGRRFDNAVEAGLQTILEAPERWPRDVGDFRRYRLKRFPYGICYRIDGDTVTVFAVMHLHRRPGYWLDRG